MIDLLREDLLTLAQGARTLPPGRRDRPTAPSTLYRWATAGIRGRRLDVIRVGGRLCTSRQALQRFFDTLTAPPPAVSAPVPKPDRARQTARDLDRLGI